MIREERLLSKKEILVYVDIISNGREEDGEEDGEEERAENGGQEDGEEK